MSTERRELVTEAATRVLSNRSQAADPIDSRGWDRHTFDELAGTGLLLTGIPEDLGGSGGDATDAAIVVEAAGRYPVRAPIAETGFVGGWLLARAGLFVPSGPFTIALGEITATREAHGWRLHGRCERVPWACIAETIVVVARAPEGRTLVVRVPADVGRTFHGRNLAGEHRDDLLYEGAFVNDRDGALVVEREEHEFFARAALARVLLGVGALHGTLALCRAHANFRQQFGRPLRAFQAVQHQLAVMANEVLAVQAAADHAVSVADEPGWTASVAVAKVRLGRAVGVVAPGAHQLHGAIGFTAEHDLHRYSLRLWSWCNEYGGEEHWARVLWHLVACNGNPWRRLVLADAGDDSGR